MTATAEKLTSDERTGAAEQPRITVLPNGLRVVSDPMPAVESVALGIWVGVGTRHEAEPVNGVSHLLEHMAFKGTARRTAADIASEIEAVGGHINAYTSRENTAYYAKVLKEDVTLGVDIVADILQNSTFDPDELERERSVILQEIGQAQDSPEDVVFDAFQAAAYPGQPMGRPVLGTPEVIRTLPRADLMRYMADWYRAPRMVLAAAGRIEHERLVDLAEEKLGGLPSDVFGAADPGRYAGGDARLEDDLEQVHLVMGFEGVAYEDPDFYPLQVLSTLYGGGMSSRLFQEVREKRGLVYSIYSFASGLSDGGIFGVYAGTGEGEAGEVVRIVCDELRALSVRVGADELQRARAQLKASTLMARESTAARCEQVAQQMLIFGRPHSVDEIVERIEAVDDLSVIRAAARIAETPLTFAATGPLGKVEPYDAIQARLR